VKSTDWMRNRRFGPSAPASSTRVAPVIEPLSA
jgi:hypothetical protein